MSRLLVGRLPDRWCKLFRNCRSSYGDLTVHSEAELVAALAAIDHKLHHETVPLAVEKRLIADHKKLTQQRERVRAKCPLLAILVSELGSSTHKFTR